MGSYSKNSSETVYYNTSDSVLGGHNVTEAIESSEDIYYNESYTVIGSKLSARNIYASYNLTVIGDIEAEKISVNGNLVVDGNIKAIEIQCLKGIICSGKIQVKKLVCTEDVLGNSIDVSMLETQGSIIVTNSIDIENGCKIQRNVIAGMGISGSGEFESDTAVAADYFDFDGNVNANIYEIATMFTLNNKDYNVNGDTFQNEDQDISNAKPINEQIEMLLDSFYKSIAKKEEDEILDELKRCALAQSISFKQLHYLFNEIIRISYYNSIENLKDYLLIVYAENVFCKELMKYETIDHVFKVLKPIADVDSLTYKADSLLEFVISLNIVSEYMRDDIEDLADRIFSFVGIKYRIVKRQFEEE